MNKSDTRANAAPRHQSHSVAPICVRGVTARYGSRTILRDIDFDVARGEVHVVLGASGCGKSTLLRTIIGLLPPVVGTIELLGSDLYGADDHDRDELLRRLGVLFQSGALLNSLPLFENVALPLRECTDLPETIISEMVRMKLALVGLDAAAHLTPREISGGMKKRAGLARALALDPELLLCDEPSAGLDPVTAAALDDLLLGLRERFGMTIVVVTHELASIRRIADRVTMLGNGSVLARGTLTQVSDLPHPDIRAFFNRERRHEGTAAPSLISALGGR